jgi:SRSO17 transposase
LLEAVHRHVVPAIERQGPITAWIVDDTGIPKKGRHSVGVARQYCGQLGKRDNCQVAVTLSLANEHASLPVAYRLYLPEAWAGDAERRIKAGVPPDTPFQTKPRIALDQIRAACAAGLPRGIVLTDAAYGNDTDFRSELTVLGLIYAVGIQSSTTVWAPGIRPLPPKPWSGKGRRPTRLRRDDDHQPVPVQDLALSLPASQWRSVTWRAGTNTPLRSRFAGVRVPAAHRDDERAELRPEEWLLIEWPDSEAEPTKYWLLPADTPLPDLVAAAKGRWRIERDYEELKQEIGLNHYEGRGWRGFHHHATLCIAAYGFLIAERCLFPPRQRFDRRQGQAPALPATFRPRGASAAGTP